MIDASAQLALVLGLDSARLRARVREEELHAPHLLDLEVAQALRRLLRSGAADPWRAVVALEDLAAQPMARHSHEALLPRIWQLRDRLTAYDAAYLALAEMLDCALLTRDRGLAQVARASVAVEVL